MAKVELSEFMNYRSGRYCLEVWSDNKAWAGLYRPPWAQDNDGRHYKAFMNPWIYVLLRPRLSLISSSLTVIPRLRMAMSTSVMTISISEAAAIVRSKFARMLLISAIGSV